MDVVLCLYTYWESTRLTPPFWPRPLPTLYPVNPASVSTGGNRVVKSPRSDSSGFGFWTFFPIVNTPTKKKPQHETPWYLSVFRYEPSKSKLLRNSRSLFAAEWSTLEANISGSVHILFSIYLLIRKVF
jgi:hypothetical protein